MPQDWFSANAPAQPAAPAMPADGDWFASHAPAADFKTTNQKDESGNALVAGASKAWAALNTPLDRGLLSEAAHEIANHLDVPHVEYRLDQPVRAFAAGALGAAGDMASATTSVLGLTLTLAGLGPEGAAAKAIPGLKALLALPKVQALQRVVQVAGGAGFGVHGATQAVTAPTLGGKAQGVVEAAAGALGATSALRAPRPAGAPRFANPNPDEAAAVRFGLDRGIPVDAGTATGNAALKGLQQMTDQSLVGSLVARGANRRTVEGLERVGGELASDARGAAITPEQAGQGIRDALASKVQAHSDLADRSYERVRELEADPTNRVDIPKAPEAVDKLPQPIVGQLRRIVHEMDASGYSPGKLVNEGNGSSTYSRGSGGAKVYEDITQNLGSTPPRSEIQRELEEFLGGGKETASVKAALAVAKDRYLGRTQNLSTPELPPSAMSHPTRLEAGRVTSEDMGLPTDLAPVKAALQPLYDQMTRQLPITQQQANPGLKAIQNILEGPDWAPLTQADRDLSAIKSLAREHGGLAKVAVAKLEAAVTTAARNGSPEVGQMLNRGREAVKARAATQDLVDALPGGKLEEPVAVFKRATAAHDAGVEFLRTIKEHAPQTLPQIARAKLDELLSKATAEGGFSRTDALFREWHNLGTETKQILFPQAGQRQALDHFFLLAKKLNQNMNPSGTGQAVMRMGEVAAGTAGGGLSFLATEIGTAGISALLHSQRGVKALTRVLPMQAPVTAAAIQTAAQRAGWAEVVAASRSLGFPMAVPAAAQSTPQEVQK